MILEVLKFPDPRLRKKGAPVARIAPEHLELAQNMLDTMYEKKGIGLAAPQVGQSVRLVVIDVRGKDENGAPTTEDLTELELAVEQPLIAFNPLITRKVDKTTYDEGCLSVPGFFETVERAQYIEVKYLAADGSERLLKADGLLAICIQHEIDHLDGKLFIDRLSVIKSTRIKNRIKKSGYPTPEEAKEELRHRRERRGRQSQNEGAAGGEGEDGDSDEKEEVAL
jgi:peptide deformylase